LDAEEAVPENAGGAGKIGHAFLLHHAGADCRDDPFKPINEYGRQRPMKLSANDGFGAPKSRVRKVSEYVPRQAGSWVAGGNECSFDRIE